MKKKLYGALRVPFAVLLLVWVCAVNAYAQAGSDEINAAITLDGSIPLSWDNDETYPWNINSGYVSSGNGKVKDSTSSLSFSYNSDSQTEVTFEWYGHDSSSHKSYCYVDGECKMTATSSWVSKRFYLPAGNHVVEFRDSLFNSTGYYTSLRSVKVSEMGDLKGLLTEKSKPISFTNDSEYPWIWKEGVLTSSNYSMTKTVSRFEGTFTVDRQSRLQFKRRVGYNAKNYTDKSWYNVYVDGELRYAMCTYTSWAILSFSIEPGTHTVVWEYEQGDINSKDAYGQIKEIELLDDWVEVDITPGSLGVEVLYKVDVLQDVKLLKVNGTMNADDWANVKKMVNVVALDFSGAKFDAIPANAFNGLGELCNVKLPEGLKTIGKESFKNTYIDYLEIPASVEEIAAYAFQETRLREITFREGSNLKTIRYAAFQDCKNLKEFIMPNSVTQLLDYYGKDNTDTQSDTFRGCSSLKKLWLSDNLTNIPYLACYDNKSLTDLKLPANLKTIRMQAFENASSLKSVRFPETLEYIGNSSFEGCDFDSVCIPVKTKTILTEAFRDNKNLKYVEIPSYNSEVYNNTFYNCTAIEKIVCRAATPPSITGDPFYGLSKSRVELVVPSFAVVNYKLHNYWYQFGSINEGDDVDYWMVSGDLSLVNNRRMKGKPDIDLTYGGRLTVAGNAPMTAGKMNLFVSEGNPSRLLNTCPEFTADEINTVFYVEANKWYFITPMADVKIADVAVSSTTSYVFRYYDGASRADLGTGSNWKNVTDTHLKAGQGYIFLCNATGTVTFPVEASLHAGLLSSDALAIPLVSHPSDNDANKGWNYLGNPFTTYYDIRYMDFTAPITIFDGSTYRAYSITDDDFVLRPMQGFFVQKPDAIDALVMHASGKQLSPTVDRASYAPGKENGDTERAIFNIELTSGDFTDMTRVVLNENASIAYETERDASKFMALDETLPQIYTLDGEWNQLAINERPLSDGKVKLGVYTAGTDREYTIRASRCDGAVSLLDLETGIVTDLANGSYSFRASQEGYTDGRFVLTVEVPWIAGADTLEAGANVKAEGGKGCIRISGGCAGVEIYRLDGTLVATSECNGGQTTVEAGQGIYVVKAGNKVWKVAVK